ncbi:hypothetical protein ANCDUO_20747, partial [Ancylostoma duodenale]
MAMEREVGFMIRGVGLAALWRANDQDCLFLEMSRNVAANQHLVIECVPVPVEVGDTAPIYFKVTHRIGMHMSPLRQTAKARAKETSSWGRGHKKALSKCRERHGFVGILTQIIEWSSELDARRQQFPIREYFLLLDSELMKSAK